MNEAVRKVLAHIDASREEMAEFALKLANTYAPVGMEANAAHVIDEWYREHSFRSRVVNLVGQRANVVATLDGNGTGKSILFNAHLDSEASGHDYDTLMGGVPDPNKVGAWREDDRFFGHLMLNDRHAHVQFMFAARAIRESGIELGADILLTSVAGETGQAPVDEYNGLEYEGKGFGSTFLVEHGMRADYAIVSETSDFALCWHHCGANYYKITLSGYNMYTPRLKRGKTLREHPNAISQAGPVINAIEDWAVEFTERRSGQTPCGPVVPNAQIGAIRGGIPWRPNRSSPYCALYVDVRTLPGERVEDVTADLRAALDKVGVDYRLELIMSKPGQLGVGIEPLADAIRSSCRAVRGGEPRAEAEQAVVSMWRDTNVFNRAGIPSINFGPSRGQADVQGRGYLTLDDLVDTAKMYALTALKLTNGLSDADLGLA